MYLQTGTFSSTHGNRSFQWGTKVDKTLIQTLACTQSFHNLKPRHIHNNHHHHYKNVSAKFIFWMVSQHIFVDRVHDLNMLATLSPLAQRYRLHKGVSTLRPTCYVAILSSYCAGKLKLILYNIFYSLHFFQKLSYYQHNSLCINHYHYHHHHRHHHCDYIDPQNVARRS